MCPLAVSSFSGLVIIDPPINYGVPWPGTAESVVIRQASFVLAMVADRLIDDSRLRAACGLEKK